MAKCGYESNTTVAAAAWQQHGSSGEPAGPASGVLGWPGRRWPGLPCRRCCGLLFIAVVLVMLFILLCKLIFCSILDYFGIIFTIDGGWVVVVARGWGVVGWWCGGLCGGGEMGWWRGG